MICHIQIKIKKECIKTPRKKENSQNDRGKEVKCAFLKK